MVEGAPFGRPAFSAGCYLPWLAAHSPPGLAWCVAGLPSWWIPPDRVVGYHQVYYTTLRYYCSIKVLRRHALHRLEEGDASTRVPTPMRGLASTAERAPEQRRRLPQRQDDPHGAAGWCARDGPPWPSPLS